MARRPSRSFSSLRVWTTRALTQGLLAACVVLGVGCVRGAPRGPETAVALPSPAEIERAASQIRGLPNTRPAPIRVVDSQRFRQNLFGDAGGTRSTARGAAFGDERVNLRDVLGEQTVGYYDSVEHSIYLRGDLPWDEALVDLVAHEVTHSLQAQNLPKVHAANESLDAHLAREALLEGDAMMVMLAYSSHRKRVPVRRSLARAAAMVADVAFERFLDASRGNELLRAAHPALQARVIFPYLRGLTFVGDLWRTGGFELVNRAYSAPPSTTEHILHPEKYLAGERAVPVRPPQAAAGGKDVISGTMGELSTRLLLERCMAPAEAHAAAKGWGGDSFTISKTTSATAVLWATTWDSEADAQEFHAALARFDACAEGAKGALLTRSAQHVVYASGAPPRAGLAEELLALIGPVPEARAPFGPLTIPPLRRPRPTRPPFISGHTYVNEYLGLTAQVPPGATVDLSSPTAVLFKLDGPITALAGIELSEAIAVPQSVDEIHGALRNVVADAIGDYSLDYAGGRDVYLDTLGHGIERAWVVRGTDAGLTATVVPVCGGTGSFVFWRFFVDLPGRTMLDAWLAGLRPTAWSVPPVCAVLDP